MTNYIFKYKKNINFVNKKNQLSNEFNLVSPIHEPHIYHMTKQKSTKL